MRRTAVILAVLLALAGCTVDGEEVAQERPPETSEEAGAPTEGPPAEPAPEPEPEPCRHDELEPDGQVSLAGLEPVDLAVEIADRTHRCAEVVVVAPDDDAWASAIAAAAAVHLDAPLLLDPGAAATRAAIERLEPDEVVTVGAEMAPGTLDPAITVTVLRAEDRAALARRVADQFGLETLFAVPEDDERGRTAVLARLDGQSGVLPLPDDLSPSEIANGLAPTTRLRVLASDDRAGALVDGFLGVGVDAVRASAPLFRSGTRTSWLTDPGEGATVAVTAVGARGRSEALLPIDAEDLRRGRDDAQRIRNSGLDRAVVTGSVTPDADWQLRLIRQGPELPGGGFTLFDEDRIMVALYGSPETPVLGAMGEQPLDETVPRLREVAEPYGAEGAEVLPAFEIISTIASANPEPTGDYSRRTPIELIRPWVDRAAEEGIYVILDLQPGRTDFLTQAQEYEELLLEPHVGLALDPEWRLLPNQVHLQQIGSVDAEEVQQVADWLAELTRDNALPEKLLILHQFRFSMLPDRDDIVAPPELAVVVHMDGQGPQGAKDETYAAITGGAEDRWLWGWKNFYDEDDPTATPEKVLGLEPPVVFVSYQ